jgi:predicted permease
MKPTDEWGFAAEGKAPGSGIPSSTLLSWVSGDAMKALGLTLMGGRFLSDADAVGAPNVVVVNESLARQTWPGENPIGKRLGLGGKPNSDADWKVVVGVVRDVRQGLNQAEARPETFQTLAQGNASMTKTSAAFAIRNMYLVINCLGNPAPLVSTVLQLINQQDPALPVTEVQTLDQYVSGSVNPQRFDAYLVGLFAALALLLALVGIGGVLSYSVAQRASELGIRMALGGKRGDILQLVLGDGLKLALVGIVIGTAIAFVISRFLASLLYQTSTADALTFTLVPLFLLIPTVGTSLIPAWRATRIDPVVALRTD